MRRLALLFLFISSVTFAQVPNLVISEIMYNPAESGTDSTEFIEIYNNDTSAINLNAYYFSNGIDYTFPNIAIAQGEYIIVTKDSLAMVNTLGYLGAYQWTSGSLSNSGELILLKDTSGNTVDSVHYDDSGIWPSGTSAGNPNGGGSSIVLCDYYSDNSDGANWSASTSTTGIIVNSFEVIASPEMIDFVCPCTTPINATTSNITLSSADLNWDAVAGAWGYRIRYKEVLQDWSLLIFDTITSNSYNLAGLNVGTDYHWQILAMCDSMGTNNSPWASFNLFNTLYTCASPINDTVISITSNSATLTWDAVPGAWGYSIRYKESSQPWGNWIYDTVQTNSLALSPLSIGTNYHWQISSMCDTSSVNNNTPYSGYLNFSTLSTCSTPTNLNTTAITENSAIFNWDAMPGVWGYRVRYKRQAQGWYTWIYDTVHINTYNANSLFSNSSYQWMVTALCDSTVNNNSLWSLNNYFTTGVCSIAFASDTLSVCNQDSILLDAGSGYSSYNWSTGDSTQSIYANSSGTYTVDAGNLISVQNNYSMSFDGVDDYLFLPQNNLSILNNTSTSISFWFKMPTQVQYPYDMVLLTNHWSSLNNTDNILVIGLWGSATPTNEGKIYGHLRDGANNVNTHITSNMRVDDGVWHYYSMVIDKNQSKAFQYIDGSLDQTYLLPNSFNFDKGSGWKCSGD